MAHRQLASAASSAARVGRLKVARRVGQRAFSLVPSPHGHGRRTHVSQRVPGSPAMIQPFSTASDAPVDKKEEIEFQA